MAKPKFENGTNQKHSFGIPVARMEVPPWQETVGMFISGQAEVDELDLVAIEMERKWGAGRLRLLVDTVLREKFDRQRYLVNQALWHGQLQDVIMQARRMITAWQVLDRAADAAGADTLAPEVWEGVTPDGTVVAIVKNDMDLRLVAAQGRHVEIYTMDEIARLLAAYPALAAAKASFPGAQVTRVSSPPRDPLQAVPDSKAPIDDTLPF